MATPELHDDDIEITADGGAVVMRMHPDDAGTIRNAVQGWSIHHADDEVIVEWAVAVMEKIDRAVFALGYNPENASRFDPDTITGD